MTYEEFQQATQLDKLIKETTERIEKIQPILPTLTMEDKEQCEVKVGEYTFSVHPDCVEYLVAGLLNIEQSFKQSLQDKFEAL